MSPHLSHIAPGATGKFRVAICGAGIGGLALAITIGKYDPSIPIDIYEAHGSINTPGVGISVWRQTHDVLVKLGLIDHFKEIFTHNTSTRGPSFRRSDIHEGGYNWFQLTDRTGRSAMQRQQMVAILEKHLPASSNVFFNKRLVRYVEPGQDALSVSPIRLEFEDGTTATTDLLIGADGIRSAVRKTMFETVSKDNGNEEADLGQYIDATFTGISLYRGLVSAEILRKEDPENIALREMTGYAGKGMYFVTYPIAKCSLVNIVAYVCDPSLTGTHYEGNLVSNATRDELVERSDNFEPGVRAMLRLCENPSKWALHVVKPLPFCAQKRVALIGDACHAMTPHFGAGSVQAIDDAFILGRLVAHPLTSLSRIQDALRIYEEIRFPVARSVADLSLSTGWMYAFMAPGYYDGTRKQVDLDEHGVSSYEREGMEAMRQEISQRWYSLDDLPSAVQTWEDAELKLQALAGQMAN